MKNVVINTQKAKYLALLVMFPFMALVFWMYYHVNGFDLDCLSWGFLVALLMLILCLSILHELIHGITWSLFTKNHFHSIDFGFIWSSFSPYCTCSEPLEKWQYLLGTAMPTLVLGGGGCSGCGDDKSVTAVFCSRIHDFIRWRRFSTYTEKYIN